MIARSGATPEYVVRGELATLKKKEKKKEEEIPGFTSFHLGLTRFAGDLEKSATRREFRLQRENRERAERASRKRMTRVARRREP